jgi:hypothetical protein
VSMQFGISVEKLGNRRELVICAVYPMRDTARRALAQRIRVVVKGSPGTRRSLSGHCLRTPHDAAAATSAGPRSSRACLGARCRSG